MNRVAIIDYGMCNLDSIARAIEECGGDPFVTDQASDLGSANRIVLPGVGAFPDAMGNLRELRLDVAMAEQVLQNGIPFLGICLGMQLLAERGWEVRETEGLGWLSADVRRFEPGESGDRVPHVGWNEVYPTRESALFRGVRPGADFYFVHSFHVDVSDEAQVLARTPYCGQFVSAAERDNVFAVQFHPEKSQKAGFQVLRNFLAI